MSADAPTRRWFPFRLRTLLVLMVVFAAGLGWVMKERRRIRDRREFFDLVDQFGAIFSDPYDSFRDRTQPAWRKLIYGDDWPEYSGIIESRRRLFIRHKGINDENVCHLKCLTNLEELVLVETQITDEGIKRLQVALPKCKIKRQTWSEFLESNR